MMEFGSVANQQPSMARLLSNRWLRKVAPEIKGKVLSIGSGADIDWEGRRYRTYFSKADNYHTSELNPEKPADLCLDVRNMGKLEDGSYDCVFCSGVLEHVDDIFGAMREIARILRVGGTLLLGIPFNQALHAAPCDYWRMTAHGLRYLLQTAGFEVKEIIPIAGRLNFPATYWSRSSKTG
jgi:SAM-dependent methyltransferase